MKFSEMPYARPDLDELKQQLQALTDQLKSAPDYASAHEAFLAQQKLSTHIDTLATLSSVRNSIDTRDKFYDAEVEYADAVLPELEEYLKLLQHFMDDAQNSFPSDLMASTPVGSAASPAVTVPAAEPLPVAEPVIPVADPFAPIDNFAADDLD